MFEREWTVRFSDTDPFGIAHYPRIVDKIHETSDMFMQDIGYPFWEMSQDHDFGLPLVEMNFEFENPMEAGDDVTIGLSPTPGNQSVKFEYVARCDGEETFSGHEYRVCARMGNAGAMELPDDLRAAMEQYAED